MSPAPGREARGKRACATIALRHDDAIPHKWGCDAEAAAIAAGKARKRRGKLALPLVRPHIGSASPRIAWGRDARPSDAGRALVTRGASLPPVPRAERDGRQTCAAVEFDGLLVRITPGPPKGQKGPRPEARLGPLFTVSARLGRSLADAELPG